MKCSGILTLPFYVSLFFVFTSKLFGTNSISFALLQIVVETIEFGDRLEEPSRTSESMGF